MKYYNSLMSHYFEKFSIILKILIFFLKNIKIPIEISIKNFVIYINIFLIIIKKFYDKIYFYIVILIKFL